MASNMTAELLEMLKAPPGKKIDLKKDYDPGFTGEWMNKEEAKQTLAEGVQRLAALQDKLYAQDNFAVLMVLQALDAAGKDSTIRHVMSGVNPQGVVVHSFKAPAGEEMDHDYLWRHFVTLPRRGNIGIFNRSYYEEMLVVRVHPEFIAGQKLPSQLKDKNIWRRRFEEVNNFEKYLVNNGIQVVKFYLNVSREAQKERFLERIMLPEKNWKFSLADVKERERFDDYLAAYEDMINHTSTRWAPWYIVPADNQWFSRLAVAEILIHTLESLNLAYPTVGEAQKEALLTAKKALELEGSGKEAESTRTVEEKGASQTVESESAGQGIAHSQVEAKKKKKKKSKKKKK